MTAQDHSRRFGGFRGMSGQQVAAELAVLALMLVIVSSLAISRYRVTLD